MFETITTILFIAGLLLETIGFLLGAVEHIPSMLRFVSPNYLAAKCGIGTLQSAKAIRASDIGFSQIAKIFIDEVCSQNSPEVIKQVRVSEIRLKGTSGIAFGSSGVRETVPVTVALANGQEIEWQLPTIKAKVEKLKSRNLFIWGVILFVAGLVAHVIGFLVDSYAKVPA